MAKGNFEKVVAGFALGVVSAVAAFGAVEKVNKPDSSYKLEVSDGSAFYNCFANASGGDPYFARIINEKVFLWQDFSNPEFSAPVSTLEESIAIAKGYCDAGIVPKV